MKPTRKLTLKLETLRVLTATDLAGAAGGAVLTTFNNGYCSVTTVHAACMPTGPSICGPCAETLWNQTCGCSGVCDAR